MVSNEFLFQEYDMTGERIQIEKMQKMDTTKICAFFGCVYFQKKVGDKDACNLYDYTGCCSSFKYKIKQFDNIIILIELICQLCLVKYNSMLVDRLREENTFYTNFLLFLFLVLFTSLIGIIYVHF